MLRILVLYLIFKYGISDQNITLKKTLIYPKDPTFYIGVLLPIHSSVTRKYSNGEEDVCHKFKGIESIQAIEYLLYCLDEINSSELLPTIDLGVLILDSCNSPDIAVKQTIKISRGFFAQENEHHTQDFQCSDNSTPTYKDNQYDKVIGIIGGQISDVSIQMAHVGRLFGIPQISYLSTSSLLSNKQKFPYFLRTVPADNYQAEVILNVMEELEWHQAHLVYSTNDYGASGRNELMRKADKYGVCFIDPLGIDPSASDETIINIAKLLKVGGSKVVVVFADADVTSRLLTAVGSYAFDVRFRWIGSDSWTLTEFVARRAMGIVEGAIGIQPKAMKIPEFEEYFRNLNLKNNKKNVWFQEFWENYFDCTLDSNLTKRLCNSAENLKKKSFNTPNWLPFLRDAIYAYAHGLHNMWRDNCLSTDGVCEKMAHNGHLHEEDLFQYILNATFKDIDGEDFGFMDTRSGFPRYTIFNYQNINNTFKWVKVGNYSMNVSSSGTVMKPLNLDKMKIRIDVSENSLDSCATSCKLGEALVYLENSCCGICKKCDADQVVDSFHGCKSCDKCERPDVNRTKCVPKDEQELNFKNQWAITAVAVASIGIFSTIIIGVIFWLYLDTPIIKAASRELSFTLLIGIFLSFCMTFLIISPPNAFTCGATRFLMGFSYTVCYAAILTKTNRIYRIFKKYPLQFKKVKFISCTSMITFVFIIISIEIFINVIWLLYQNPMSVVICYPNKEFSLKICKGMEDHSYIVGFLYPFCLVGICTIYAIRTRKCPVGYNEARFIGFTNYATCILWVVFLPVYISTESVEHIRAVLLALALSLGGFVQLGCLFFPKVHVVLFKPEKNTRDAVMRLGCTNPVISDYPENSRGLSGSTMNLKNNEARGLSASARVLRSSKGSLNEFDQTSKSARPNTIPSISAITEEIPHEDIDLSNPMNNHLFPNYLINDNKQ